MDAANFEVLDNPNSCNKFQILKIPIASIGMINIVLSKTENVNPKLENIPAIKSMGHDQSVKTEYPPNPIDPLKNQVWGRSN